MFNKERKKGWRSVGKRVAGLRMCLKDGEDSRMSANPRKGIQRRFKRACIWDGVDLEQTGGTKGTRGQIHFGKVERHFRDRSKEMGGRDGVAILR